MADSKDLIHQVAREIEASKRTSQTAAGRTEPPARQRSGELVGEQAERAERAETAEKDARIDAINQVFALFRLNYHNQFYAAFPDSDQLNQVKKLWLDALWHFPVEQILRGAKQAIESSDYLPTLNRMIECCRESLSAYGLPEARVAYREACNAASPKSAQAWSHPAVYLAGRDADWFFLASEPETRTWPVFQQIYQRWCERVMSGEQLTIEAPAALPESSGKVSSREDALAELARIREQLG